MTAPPGAGARRACPPRPGRSRPRRRSRAPCTRAAPSGGPPGAISVDPANPSTVYAASYAGVFKTTNRGGSWPLLNSSPEGGVALAIGPGNPSVVYVGTNKGVAKTTDGGDTWIYVNSGLTT